MTAGGDPFGTAALRGAVLDAWTRSSTRFREDANAEEDLRLDGYADAWFVELAQNAADAARAAGVPGRVEVDLVDGELRVANTGAPLDAAGVAALASLRASAKRDDAGSVGRFGVGFAAVLPLSDAPRVVGSGGGVAFSAARTAAAVDALGAASTAAAELTRRDEPPVLRLAWPTDERPPAGYDTQVRLPLRSGVVGADLLARARDTAPDLLLALPDLVEIAVGGSLLRRVDGPGPDEVTVGERRWLLSRRTGRLDDDARERATEQRDRRDWSACWALPLTTGGGPQPAVDDVLHAPTATAERLGLPARLIATVPLEPDRRRVRPGPAADHVLAGAAAAYLDLVRAVAPGRRLALVPEPGFPRSGLDERLRGLLLDALRGAAWLPGAAGADLVPGRAEWLDVAAEPLPELLATAGFDRLAAAGPVPAVLGVHRITAAELVARLFGLEQPPAWWHAVYAALAPAAETVPGLLDELRALPVPLAGGRSTAGPAGVLVPTDPPGEAVALVAALALPGLHVADPVAVHPLLTRLGATAADPAGLLEHPALAAAVGSSVDDADAGLDPEPLAAAVLALVAEVGRAPARFAALALPAAGGGAARADELMLPDAALAPLLAPDAPLDVLDAAFAARFPRAALVGVGVLDGFALVVDEDPVAPDHDLDDEERWWAALERPPARLVAVRDLDLVDDGAWPAALALLAADRGTRTAITTPGSYAAWWLARHARPGGRRPAHWRLPSAAHLAPLFDALPGDEGVGAGPGVTREPLDEPFLSAIGVRGELGVEDAAEARDLLERLADPARRPDATLTAQAHAALVDALHGGRLDVDDLDPPEHVRALDGSVVGADLAAVLDAPWPAAVLPPGGLVIGGGAALAELLDLPVATGVVEGGVVDDGRPVPWSALAEVVVACHTLGVPVPDGGLQVHDELWVTLRRPTTGRVRVPTWFGTDGRWHAEDPLRALLALLAAEHDG